MLFNPHMTVRRNLGYGLPNRGMAKPVVAERVEAAARLLEIDDFLDRKPAQLSGGQRQRVAMGRAIVREPALFLFDEPLSNLDAKLRNDMRPKLKALQRRIGTAMIYVTHDQLEAMTLADKIVVLNGGRVEQIGTPSEVYSEPASAFVAGFIGTPPMNVVPAEVTDRVLSIEGFTVADNVAHRGPVLLGLRPEALRVASADTGLSVPVEAIEELGATRLLHVSFGTRPLVISQGADEPVPGSRASLAVRRDQMHLFEPAGGKRLPASVFGDAR